jgi:hypothetical protein
LLPRRQLAAEIQGEKMTPDEIEKIYREVKEHYDGSSHPYYLSRVGTFMAENKISKAPSVSLKDYLSEIFKERLPIVQDPTVPARVAITTPETKEQVTAQIVGKSQAALGISEVDHRRLPFALLAAFCKPLTEGKRLFFRTAQPFRYHADFERPADPTYIEIDPDFLIPSLWGKDAKSLSEEERVEINRKIGEWSRNKSINLQSLYVKQGDRDLAPRGQRTLSSDNALQRLIAAQDPELRDRIRIPLDIADALMRIP